jgi:hypothetical protein
VPRSINEIIAENERLEALLDSGVREELLAIAGVFHVTIGLKEVAGRAGDTLCIKTYVRRKVEPADLSPDEIVPVMVGGVPTDVSEVPEIRLAADTGRHRPIVGGTQLTNGIKVLDDDQVTTVMVGGTLGCLAVRTQDGEPVLLTNWHIATAHGGRVGDSLFQPFPEPSVDLPTDTYPKRPRSSVNAVAKIVDAKVSEKFDCAIATVNTCYSLCCNCGVSYDNRIRELAVGGGDAVAGTAPVVSQQQVFKVGRVSDRTAGRVVTTDFPRFVATMLDGTTRVFTGQIQIQGDDGPFAVEGDSGSVVVDEQRRVVGLLFALSDDNTFAFVNHVSDVVAALGITITGGESGLNDSAEPADVLGELSGRLRREFSDRVDLHQAEVVSLVNHDRHVTVAWHRAQGPAWIAALARSARRPAYLLPHEIEGVTRAEAFTLLHTALSRFGSDGLRADLAEYGERLLTAFSGCRTTGELLDSAGSATPATMGVSDAEIA